MTTEPIVCLHGFLGDGRDLEPLADGLRAGGAASVVCPTLPGHGPDPEPVTGRGNPFFAVVETVAARLEMTGVTRFHVVGYSMGGRIAYGLAIKFPDRVRSVCAIGASPGIASSDARAERHASDRERSRVLESDGLPSFLESWYAMPLFDTLRDSAGFEALLARRRDGRAPELAAALRAMSPGIMPDLAPDLARGRVPVLALAGARDEAYVAVVRALAAASPHIEARVIADAGHAAHVEQREAVIDAVATFIRRVGE